MTADKKLENEISFIKNIKLKDSYCLCNLKSPYYTKQYLPISEDIMQVFIQIIGKGIEHGKASC